MENYSLVIIIGSFLGSFITILFLRFIYLRNLRRKDIRKVWERIYREWFNLEKDFSNLQIPRKYNPKKHFPVIMAQELTKNQLVTGMRKIFNVNLYFEDLDENVVHDDRTAEKGDYIILFNNNINVINKFKCISADQLQEIGHRGITLAERLLLEVFYFDRAKKHLDQRNNWTLCSGSWYLNGDVLFVYSFSNLETQGIFVGSWVANRSCGNLYSREVVSL